MPMVYFRIYDSGHDGHRGGHSAVGIRGAAKGGYVLGAKSTDFAPVLTFLPSSRLLFIERRAGSRLSVDGSVDCRHFHHDGCRREMPVARRPPYSRSL